MLILVFLKSKLVIGQLFDKLAVFEDFRKVDIALLSRRIWHKNGLYTDLQGLTAALITDLLEQNGL